MIKSQNSTKTSTKSEIYTQKKKKTQIRKSEEISEPNLFTCARVGIELEGKSGIGSEGVSVEMREALRDVNKHKKTQNTPSQTHITKRKKIKTKQDIHIEKNPKIRKY